MFTYTDHHIILDDEKLFSKVHFKIVESFDDLDNICEYLKTIKDSYTNKYIFSGYKLKNIQMIAAGLKEINILPYCVLRIGPAVHFALGSLYKQLEPSLNPHYIDPEPLTDKNDWNKFKDRQSRLLESMDKVTFIKVFAQAEVFFVNYRFRAKNIKMKYEHDKDFESNYRNFEKLVFQREIKDII